MGVSWCELGHQPSELVQNSREITARESLSQNTAQQWQQGRIPRPAFLRPKGSPQKWGCCWEATAPVFAAKVHWVSQVNRNKQLPRYPVSTLQLESCFTPALPTAFCFQSHNENSCLNSCWINHCLVLPLKGDWCSKFGQNKDAATEVSESNKVM